ncbi:MAG: translation initiation factor IF-2 N-terminal domain-containing protein, partial [Macrococcus canis]|uniref:translation initiation factor IF-2 N-terminal domain-containing protein n=1 Tax=Macrococcoides canis TaxID=1855823 RepID=UPI002E78C1D9
MSKKRIYEYAKEVSLKSKDIIDALKKMNIEVSSHMQVIEANEITALDKIFKKSDAKAEVKPEQKADSKKVEPKKEEPKKEEQKKQNEQKKPQNNNQ